jgi:glucose-6-phosphate dehydrogenase assembly protein OpcA
VILDLPSTTSSAINKKMVEMREQGGANAQGRVLTLVIVTDEDSSEDPIAAANGASFEHPCRVIVVAKGSRRGAARLDAQIRVGGDAGASEVIILRLWGPLAEHGAAVVIPLLLPDAPVVAWWPGESPESPAQDPIGALAQRRITDSAAVKRPIAALTTRRTSYQPGDTDLAWTRLTNWRGLLAAALDQPPHEKILEATVAGASDSASADLLAGWLAMQLRCPVRRIKVDRAGSGLRAVTLTRRSGEISLVRPEGVTATLAVSNQSPRELTLPRRILRDIIAEELRRLDADEVYADVLSKGLDLVAKQAAADSATAVRVKAAARAVPRSKKPTLKAVSKATVAPDPQIEPPAMPKPARKPTATKPARKAGTRSTATKATK